MALKAPVITIDGPSGTGKGTIAHLLAKKLGWHLLDSGALYRVVALGSLAEGIQIDQLSELCKFAGAMDVVFSSLFEGSILLNNKEVSEHIRSEDTGERASIIAAKPELRMALLTRQHHFRQFPGLVADGRDMGTVVFPDAKVKFFLTASAEERAQRRYKQLINKGVGVNLRALLEDIKARDERDITRKTSPLIPAEDAIQIETTELDIEQVLTKVMKNVASVIRK